MLVRVLGFEVVRQVSLFVSIEINLSILDCYID